MNLNFENFKKGFTDDYFKHTLGTSYSDNTLSKLKEFNIEYFSKNQKLIELYVHLINKKIQYSFEQNNSFKIVGKEFTKQHSEEDFINVFIRETLVPLCIKTECEALRLDREGILDELNWKYFQYIYTSKKEYFNALSLSEVLDLYKNIRLEEFEYIQGGNLVRDLHSDKVKLEEIGYRDIRFKKLVDYELSSVSSLHESLMFVTLFSSNWNNKSKKEKNEIVKNNEYVIFNWLAHVSSFFKKGSRFLENKNDRKNFIDMLVYAFFKNEKNLINLGLFDIRKNEENINIDKFVKFKEEIINKLSKIKGNFLKQFSTKKEDMLDVIFNMDTSFKIAHNMCSAKIIANRYPERYIYSIEEREQYNKITFPQEEILKDLDLRLKMPSHLFENYHKILLNEGLFGEDILVNEKRGFFIISQFKNENNIDLNDLKEFIKNCFHKEVILLNNNDFIDKTIREENVKNEWRAFVLNYKLQKTEIIQAKKIKKKI